MKTTMAFVAILHWVPCIFKLMPSWMNIRTLPMRATTPSCQQSPTRSLETQDLPTGSLVLTNSVSYILSWTCHSFKVSCQLYMTAWWPSLHSVCADVNMYNKANCDALQLTVPNLIRIEVWVNGSNAWEHGFTSTCCDCSVVALSSTIDNVTEIYRLVYGHIAQATGQKLISVYAWGYKLYIIVVPWPHNLDPYFSNRKCMFWGFPNKRRG
jgi:hypothetical protein